MRKLSLQTYSMYELKRIDFDHSLKIMNMLYDAENDNVRLLPPLVTWLYLNDKGNLQTGTKIKNILTDMYKKYPDISEENALKYLKHSKNDELKRFYRSFVSENLRRDENEFKNKMRNAIRILQKKKGLSNYKICKLSNVDMGNFHSYYVLNNNDKLSKDKIKTIIQVCNNY